MDDSLETDEKPRNNQQNSKVKAVVLVLVGIASLSALIWIFNTPWRYVAPGPTVIQTGKEINKDDLLQLVRQQKKLIVGQVLIKTSTWDSRKKERSWWSTKTAIRGWTMPCRIDVDIDLAKLSPGAFDLVTQGDGTRLFLNRKSMMTNARPFSPTNFVRFLTKAILIKKKRMRFSKERLKRSCRILKKPSTRTERP